MTDLPPLELILAPENTEPVNGARLLDELAAFVRRYVVLTTEQVDTVALWTAHTHVIDAADTTAYLAATSAEKRSGKTRLLEVLELVVRQPLPTANISDAALFRAIAELTPTLLLDEVDAIFGPKARDREDLRGLLNAGYRRGAVARRMGGARMTTLEAFPVFCAKVFALIGELPDTLADRAIRIRLERRTREEQIERFRRRDVEPAAAALRNCLADWCEPHLDELRVMRPHLPDELDDRAQDCWEPLFAIADLAGGGWSDRARIAALTLSGPAARNVEDASLSARLLADIHQVFSANGTERYRTADLIDALSQIEESPWGDWYGKTITAQGLSKLLRPFQIKTMPVWADGRTVRGYKREQFRDAWLRVLGVRGDRSVSSVTASEAAPNGPNSPNAQHTGEGNQPSLGEPGYAMLLDRAFAGGHITDDELRHRLALVALMAASRRAKARDRAQLAYLDLVIDGQHEQAPLDDNGAEIHDNDHPLTFDVAYLDTIAGESAEEAVA